MAITCAHMYSDNATVMITENTPDSFRALRTTRPLVAATAKGETYMATTRYGLPAHTAVTTSGWRTRLACPSMSREASKGVMGVNFQ